MTAPTLEELAAAVERPDDDVRATARAAWGRYGGRLAEVGVWLAGVQNRPDPVPPGRSRLVVVADQPPDRTAALADDLGVAVRAVPRKGVVGAVDATDPCSPEEAQTAMFAGAALADEETDAGTDLLLLGLPGTDLVVPAAALVGLLTRNDAAAVTATAQDDTSWMAACAATRDAMRRGRPHLTDHPRLLATVGGADLAFAAGLLLRAAARRTPVVLDGPVTAAAALVAARLSFRAPGWWLAGGMSPDPAHPLALERLGLEPVLDLEHRGDDGTCALLAVPVVRAAARGPQPVAAGQPSG